MDFSNIPAGCLTEGTETMLGIIEHVSLTAYMIDGRWVPFHRIHGKPQRESALAIPQQWVDALTPEMSERMARQSDANIARMMGGK